MEYKDLKTYVSKKATFSVKEIKPDVYLLNFRSYKDMCFTLLRFQEFYESPKFKNQLFTLKEFYDHYKKTEGKFSYHHDWSGFNFPSSILAYVQYMPNLTPKERQILSLFKDKNCYIIATVGNNPEILRHELCHAFFYLNKQYRQNTKKILKGKDLSNVYKFLKKTGYQRSVFLDEAHAWLCCHYGFLKRYAPAKKELKLASKKLQINYKTFLKEL